MFNRQNSEDATDRSMEPLFRTRQAVQAPGRAGGHPAQDEAAVQRSNLGEAFRLEGTLKGDADLLLEGRVKGDVQVRLLVIGPSAVVEGSVVAQEVDVRGRVIGSIQAELVNLYKSCHVEGEIRYGRLAIESGAVFEGKTQPLAKPDKAEPAVAGPIPKAGAITPFPAGVDLRDAHVRASNGQPA